MPPPAPKDFFGRDGIVEEIVGRAEKLQSFALIGAGGIGKTSIALTVLDHDRIKKRFGDDRRFISCDKFPASRVHFLACLSKAIGAGIEHPEDLTSLRPALSSKDMFIILDNAESILDPQGTDAREISTMAKELSNFGNICLGITSRIFTVPPRCKRLEIPALSMEAARDIFYSIYDDGERSTIVDGLLQHLDFHALSITLLATVASDNLWSYDRLAKEWDEHRVQTLQTDYNESLAATIELSLNSPTFRKLGPNARDLLGVVAFFPQGVEEKNLDWLFPTVPGRKILFDKFCVLSLAYRSNNFITMLAPIRDYLYPNDPRSSPTLLSTKDCYFARLSIDLYPGQPGFAEAEWVKSEDINVEHLLDVFTSIDTNALDIWDLCIKFMIHLYWHKPRQTVLKTKFEGLPDDHRSKPRCLFELSELFRSVGNVEERKRLLEHALKLEREWGDGSRVARTLRALSEASMRLGRNKEGMQQMEEALEMYKWLGDTEGQAECSIDLASLLVRDGQNDAAEDTVSSAIDFLTDKGQDFLLHRCHYALGEVYFNKDDKEKAVYHLEMALGIASPFNWQHQLFSIHQALASVFCGHNEFDDANAHIERAKSYTADSIHNLGHAMETQALIWYEQRRLEDARSEALRAVEIFDGHGAAMGVRSCRKLLRQIEEAMEDRNISSGSDPG